MKHRPLDARDKDELCETLSNMTSRLRFVTRDVATLEADIARLQEVLHGYEDQPANLVRPPAA